MKHAKHIGRDVKTTNGFMRSIPEGNKSKKMSAKKPEMSDMMYKMEEIMDTMKDIQGMIERNNVK